MTSPCATGRSNLSATTQGALLDALLQSIDDAVTMQSSGSSPGIEAQNGSLGIPSRRSWGNNQ
jgi:hypothetical protein